MNDNILHPAPVPAAMFDWDAGRRTYTAEISDLGPRFRFGRVYADACDVGFTLESRYPGRAPLVLVVSHTETRDGDTCWWDLTPADGRSRGFTVRLFND